MRREPFWRHFAGHWPVYLALLCLCVVLGATLFALTAPRNSAPRTLLICDGGPLPDTAFDARVDYPAADASPELVQAYVLTTGSGGYDYFIAPIARLQELYDQQLIQPIAHDGARALADGTPIAIDLNAAYALCLSHCASEAAAARFGNP